MGDSINGQLALDASAIQALNHSQKELLDTVDKLRYIGVDRFVDLPQIIVVGDQSSGKSSVLEAISRVRFPVHDDVCTRFATELVLRKAPRSSINVRIKPAANDSDIMKKKLEAFTRSHFNKEELGTVIEEAKTCMAIDEKEGFSKRALIIHISGPEIPALTLVDLPGFYRGRSEKQSDEGREIVNELVGSYMSQSNSIILAVMSADTRLIMQGVLTECAVHDPKRLRTYGIVTKPDAAYNEDELSNYIKLMKNEDSTLRLKSWHVLRNRSKSQGEISDERRDEMERQLFDQRTWSSIPQADKGISSLVKKLGLLLLDHIDKSLPGVISHIDTHVKNREAQLATLGDVRASPKECGRYLEGISSRFQHLVNQAVTGDYRNDEFFGNPFDATDENLAGDMRKLRTWVGQLNQTFVAVMRAKGSSRKILWNFDEDFVDDQLDDMPEHLEGLAGLYKVEQPTHIHEDDLVEEVRQRAKAYEGQDFPGSPSSKLALKLFESESRKWEKIAIQHVDLALQAVKELVVAAFFHVVGQDEQTRDSILRECVEPYFKRKSIALKSKVKELLPKSSRYGFIQAHVDEFNRRIHVREQRRLHRRATELMEKYGAGEKERKAMQYSLVAKLSLAVEDQSIHEFSVERVISNMVEYYGMTLRSFTENVVILAIENVLMSDIHNVFSDILGFEDEKLTILAGESEQIQTKRRNLVEELALLHEGLETCTKYRKPGLSSMTAEIHKLSLSKGSSTPRKVAYNPVTPPVTPKKELVTAL